MKNYIYIYIYMKGHHVFFHLSFVHEHAMELKVRVF